MTRSDVRRHGFRGNTSRTLDDIDIAGVEKDPQATEHARLRLDNATGTDALGPAVHPEQGGYRGRDPLVGDEIDIADVEEDPQATEHARMRLDNATGTDGS